MGKKKKEHIVFDKMLIPKRVMPFIKVNSKAHLSKKTKKLGMYSDLTH